MGFSSGTGFAPMNLAAGDGAVTLVGFMELNDESSGTYRVRPANVGSGTEAVIIYGIS